MSDEMLIQRIQNGDQEAFSYVIRTYGKLLWIIVGGILGHIGTNQDIEECISDVYVQVWKTPVAFNHKKGSLKTYLAVIAKSKALNAYRKLSKCKAVELDEAINSSDSDLLGYIVEKEMSKELYAAIALLSEPDKEILIRRYFLDEKPATISEKIPLSLKEVNNRLYQSKIKLRKILIKSGGVNA